MIDGHTAPAQKSRDRVRLLLEITAMRIRAEAYDRRCAPDDRAAFVMKAEAVERLAHEEVAA